MFVVQLTHAQIQEIFKSDGDTIQGGQLKLKKMHDV